LKQSSQAQFPRFNQIGMFIIFTFICRRNIFSPFRLIKYPDISHRVSKSNLLGRICLQINLFNRFLRIGSFRYFQAESVFIIFRFSNGSDNFTRKIKIVFPIYFSACMQQRRRLPAIHDRKIF